MMACMEANVERAYVYKLGKHKWYRHDVYDRGRRNILHGVRWQPLLRDSAHFPRHLYGHEEND